MGPERLCLQKLPRAWKKRFLLRLFCYRLRVLRARSRNGLELIGDALAAPEVSQIPYSHLHKKKKGKKKLVRQLVPAHLYSFYLPPILSKQ